MASPDSNPRRILIYGRDAVLLKTRRAILVKAGFSVVIAGSAAELERCLDDAHPPYRLFIACHTVEEYEQQALGEAANRANTELYALSTAISPTDFLRHVRELVSTA
ncbi:hypothetical protein [Granulicella sp. dw_53]|uniref:hypothetical protein n=1 Tax=Granulicella sp. dw_53 TaxID=2719792 RepID=UPI001BD63CF6|nr:hypothetical protein [Granulicella sp. dw_53]